VRARPWVSTWPARQHLSIEHSSINYLQPSTLPAASSCASIRPVSTQTIRKEQPLGNM